nr:hypothetical protein [Tanacetum cinerariifolium]GEV17644.1 hypothetical protein [Tanacetum cinerariifolium]
MFKKTVASPSLRLLAIVTFTCSCTNEKNEFRRVKETEHTIEFKQHTDKEVCKVTNSRKDATKSVIDNTKETKSTYITKEDTKQQDLLHFEGNRKNLSESLKDIVMEKQATTEAEIGCHIDGVAAVSQ